MEWISVEDRLPEAAQQVAVLRINKTWDRGEYAPLYFAGSPAWYLPEGPLPSDSVTHWMPIPEPPTDNDCS